jgi:hypothetical protein
MRRRSSGSLAIVVLVAWGTFAGCGEEPIPDNVTFEPTIRTLFAAHCVRCHGAGGTLNNDPDPRVFGGTDVPAFSYLDHYADQGDCTIDPVTQAVSPSCRRGALFAATTIKVYVTAKSGTFMPPPPSDRLTEWETKLVVKWSDNPLP